MVGKHFRMFLPLMGRGGDLTALQRALSVSGALKAYISPPLLTAVLCLPICLAALQTRGAVAAKPDRAIQVLLFCHFVTSTLSKKLVYSRLGGRNVSYMTANRIWTVPCKATIVMLLCQMLTSIQSTHTVPSYPSCTTLPTLASKCQAHSYHPWTKDLRQNARHSQSA